MINVVTLPDSQHALLTMHSQTDEFVCHGAFSLQVLKGSACVLGRTLSVADSWQTIYSPFHEAALVLVPIVAGVAGVRAELPDFVERTSLEKCTVAILLRRVDVSSERGMPAHAFRLTAAPPNLVSVLDSIFYYSDTRIESRTLRFGEQQHALAAELLAQARAARAAAAPRPVVFVCGRKNTGKSSFARFLANMLLSDEQHGQVAWVDCDLGQGEFVPPACVGITHVNDAVFGPSYTHDWSARYTAQQMSYVGDVNPKNCEARYLRCCGSLTGSVRAAMSHMPVIVNTHGWVTGVGHSALLQLVQMWRPACIVALHTAGGEQLASADTRSFLGQPLDSAQAAFNIESQSLVEKTTKSGKRGRSGDGGGTADGSHAPARLLPHLGSMSASAMRVHVLDRLFAPQYGPLTAVAPLRISFKSVRVALVAGVHAPPSRLLTVLNGALVGLCIDTTEYEPVPDAVVLQFVPPDAACGQCLALAIVRQIDPAAKELRLLVPTGSFSGKEGRAALRRVNTLAVGRLALPNSATFRASQSLVGDDRFAAMAAPYFSSAFHGVQAAKSKTRHHIARKHDAQQ